MSELDDPKPKLEYRTIPPDQRRRRFLERLNPNATPRSVARSAVRACIGVDIGFLAASFRWHPPLPAYFTAILVAGILAGVMEWQTTND
jgi:hypothetical protein